MGAAGLNALQILVVGRVLDGENLIEGVIVFLFKDRSVFTGHCPVLVITTIPGDLIDEEERKYLDTLREKDLLLLKMRSEEHTSELQSLMRISYAVFCLK